MIKQLPEELRGVLLTANLKWKENCILKLQLNALPDDAEKEAIGIQLKIANNWKENALCWKQIDYYLEHKQLLALEENSFDGLTAAQLVKRRQYHFQNVSKLNKKIKNNREILEATSNVKTKATLERILAKDEAKLLRLQNELQTLKQLIDGK